MTKVTTKAMAKVAAVATGLAMATSMLSLAPIAHAAALSSAQVQSILSLLSSFGADSSTIANVQASLTGSAPVTTTTTTTSGSYTFTKDLTIGSKGADVTALQNALIAKGYTLAAGATGYFGSQTQAAVIAWQKAAGVTPAAGYFGAKSRAAFGGAMTTGTTGTTGTTVQVGSGTGLKVSLSPTSPNGTVLVQKQGIGDLGDFVFANPTAAPISVTAMTFNRTGVSNDATLVNVYLYNNGTRLTDSAGVSNGQFTFSDPTALFTVPAGQTYTVSVRSDIANSTSGQQIGVSLVSVTPASGALDSSVSFPIASGYQTISAANLATVSFDSSVTPSGTPSISPQVNYTVWQNAVSVSVNPVKLSSMRFTNLGSIDGSYLTNLRLYVDGVQVGAAVPSMSGSRTVTFDFSASPLALSTQTHNVKVLADITGGSNRTIIFSVQRSSDGMFVDSQLNQPVTPVSNGSATNFSAVTVAGTVTVAAVSGSTGVSVSLDPASSSSSVAVGATSVDWATYDVLVTGENVKVNDLYVYASTSGAGGLYNGSVKVNGVNVGSTKNIGANSGAHTDFAMGSSLILPAGQTVKLDIVADAKDTGGTNLADGTTVQVYLDTVASNAQGQSSLNSATIPAVATPGNSISLTKSSLSATKYSGYGNQTMVSGNADSRIGAFTLSAGSTEGVTVNEIEFTFPSSVSSTLSSLTLKDDATGQQIGVTQSPSTTNTFQVTFDIPASSSKTIDIYANVLSGANAGPMKATLTVNTSGQGDKTLQTASITSTDLQTITLGTGHLTAAIGAGNPTSAIVIAGGAQVHAGQYAFTSQYSPYTVDQLAILIPSGAATSVSNVSLSYQDVNGATQTASASLHLPTTQPYATAVFTSLSFYVPANKTANLDVYVSIPTVANGATSGAQISTVLDSTANAYGGTGFHAKNGANSPLTTLTSGNIASTATNGQGVQVVRGSIPTLSSNGSASSLPIGANQTIGQFTVQADATGPVSWDQVIFSVTKTATVQIGATSTLTMWTNNGGSTWTQLQGKFATTTVAAGDLGTLDSFGAATSGKLHFVPTSEQQVAAGGSVSYQLRGTIADTTTTGSAYVSVTIQNPTTSVSTDQEATIAGTYGTATNPSFVWSDRSSINPTHSTASSDWTNDYLVPGLILSMPTLQTNH